MATRYFIDERDGRYNLHDRVLGYDTAIGVFKDPEIATRICALLNKDELTRAGGIRRHKELNA